MYVAVGLSVATGLPWEYWSRQDDRVVATAVDILKQARGGRSEARPGDNPEPELRPGDFRVMSG